MVSLRLFVMPIDVYQELPSRTLPAPLSPSDANLCIRLPREGCIHIGGTTSQKDPAQRGDSLGEARTHGTFWARKKFMAFPISWEFPRWHISELPIVQYETQASTIHQGVLRTIDMSIT